MSTEFINVGRIIAAFGIKGWVEVISYTEPEANLFGFSPWHLAYENQPVFLQLENALDKKIIYKIHKQKAHHHSWVAKLPEYCDRDQALTLRGAYIQIARLQLPILPPQEYYWTDLQGLEVYTVNHEYLGHVDYLFATGSNDVLVVKNADKTVCIPYISPKIIVEINLEQKKIIVDWTA